MSKTQFPSNNRRKRTSKKQVVLKNEPVQQLHQAVDLIDKAVQSTNELVHFVANVLKIKK
jgi:hypothetical protein